jgi:hypothetical protein
MRRTPKLALLLAALAIGAGVIAGAARAEGGDGEATWRLEQPLPPPLGEAQSNVPIGLGKIGDIEFWAPNRGLLITAGNPPSIPPGVWAYNGVGWHELSNQCGASDGRIAWAGPDEFWTVSDGRPGQSTSEGKPPLEDNTLCHFAGGQIVASYASLAFLPSSYQAMHGAACLGPEDCWFGGNPLPDGQTGAFHLHWDGHSLRAEAGPQGHAVESMRPFAGAIYEGVQIQREDLLGESEPPTEPSFIHEIEPAGVLPTFVSLFPVGPLLPNEPRLPIYASGETPEALDYPRLGADERALWAAIDPTPEPSESTLGEVTILRDEAGENWTQLIGPNTDPEAQNPFTNEGGESTKNELVQAIAAEPPTAEEGSEGTEHAWLALASGEQKKAGARSPATVARLSSTASVTERENLPSKEDVERGVGPKGYASKIACPAPHDCWMATSNGWLFHLAPEGERQLPQDTDPAFNGLISFRPEDQGVPQTLPDAPPEDNSGLLGELQREAPKPKEEKTHEETLITLPLLSRVHTKLVHGTTLELSFHLAAKARVRLLAERHRRVVAKTGWHTFDAGTRRLLLRLNRREWPTKLNLKTKLLGKLPTTSTRGPGNDTVSTGLFTLPGRSSFSELAGVR